MIVPTLISHPKQRSGRRRTRSPAASGSWQQPRKTLRARSRPSVSTCRQGLTSWRACSVRSSDTDVSRFVLTAQTLCCYEFPGACRTILPPTGIDPQLVEKPLLALRTLAVKRATELLDHQLQGGDLRFGVRHHRRRVGGPRLGIDRLGFRRRQRGPQRVDVRSVRHARKRITTTAPPLCQSCPMSHFTARQPARDGRQVRTGLRQSIPSSRYPSCAALIDTASPDADGQGKRPRSRRLA